MKMFIMVYLILTNKLKTNQNYKYLAYNFCTGETALFPNKKEISRYRYREGRQALIIFEGAQEVGWGGLVTPVG